ncbi:MAG: hypothetical protein JO127_11000 [Caulobacteraceae bacterium]|nr:hypothetical protein [Caulobacteraceae bacterium]
MRPTVVPGLVLVLLAISSPAHPASSLSCTQRFQAAGIDSTKLGAGDRGRLEGYAFIVAKDDSSAQKICDRVDAERRKAQGLQSELSAATSQLSQVQGQLAESRSGGPLKDRYLLIEGALLAWAVIASIWVAYLAGRLNPRHHL